MDFEPLLLLSCAAILMLLVVLVNRVIARLLKISFVLLALWLFFWRMDYSFSNYCMGRKTYLCGPKPALFNIPLHREIGE